MYRRRRAGPPLCAQPHSVNATVYLIGLAESQAELDTARAIARATGDVENVLNYMRVQAPKS